MYSVSCGILSLLFYTLGVYGQQSNYAISETELEAQETSENIPVARTADYYPQYQDENEAGYGYGYDETQNEIYDPYNRQEGTGVSGTGTGLSGTGTGDESVLSNLENLTGLDIGSFLIVFLAASLGIVFMPAILEIQQRIFKNEVDAFRRGSYGFLYPNGRSLEGRGVKSILDAITDPLKDWWLEDDQ